MKYLLLIIITLSFFTSQKSSAAVEQACGEVAEIREKLSSSSIFKMAFLVYTNRYNFTGPGSSTPITHESPDNMVRILTPAQVGSVGSAGLEIIPATVLQKETMYIAYQQRNKRGYICFKRDTSITGSKPEISMMNNFLAP